MFGLITRRCFHIGRPIMAVNKSSLLAKLRKATGYSVSNCKKALEMFPEDIEKAEEWLHEEAKSKGWAKWAKAQNHTATQGLIGVCSRDNVGVMFEVNCETDFVSRNAEFQEMVTRMLSGCMNYAATLKVDNNVTKEVLDESRLSALKCETSSLGELLVAATCKFNEKTVARRAVCLKVPNDILLSSVTHPYTRCSILNGASLGKYGVLLAAKKTKSDVNEDSKSLELNICQHIIGMNPLSVGELTEKDIAKFNKIDDASPEPIVSETIKEHIIETIKEQNTSEKMEDGEDAHVEGQEMVETALKDCDETQLMFQPFLLDQNITVGETLYKAGLEIVDFERFECGEGAEEEKVAQSAAAF